MVGRYFRVSFVPQSFMSPKKLAEVLIAILRDFEPWKDPDRDYQWGGPSVALSQQQIKALPPYSIFLALVTFSDFPYYGRSEKIAWTVPIRFRGVAYLISHQKFGLRIHPANPQCREHGLVTRERPRRSTEICRNAPSGFLDQSAAGNGPWSPPK